MIRAVTSLITAALAVGIIAGLSWVPEPSIERMPPDAAAHGDDMTARLSESPRAGEVSTEARDREPTLLRIPELGIESPVERTSMDSTGAIRVPEDVTSTGWFTGSRRLEASRGPLILVGHRDSASQGSGALFGIEGLQPGALVTVTGSDGVQRDYLVASVEFVDKSDLPDEAARIFGNQGPHRLVLITCGGDFDQQARSYRSNVIVTALPA